MVSDNAKSVISAMLKSYKLFPASDEDRNSFSFVAADCLLDDECNDTEAYTRCSLLWMDHMGEIAKYGTPTTDLYAPVAEEFKSFERTVEDFPTVTVDVVVAAQKFTRAL